MNVCYFSLGSPVSASDVSKPIFEIKVTEDKTNISIDTLSGSVNNAPSFGSLTVSDSPNPPPLIFGEALTVREPKDGAFLTDPDNVSIEMLVLYSVTLISNIGLLPSEALTGEPIEK